LVTSTNGLPDTNGTFSTAPVLLDDAMVSDIDAESAVESAKQEINI
jgi:hypothetical protein